MMNTNDLASFVIDEDQRLQVLREIKRMLNTAAGHAFVDELKEIWDIPHLRGKDAHEQTYLVGLRDAYKFIEALQNGDAIPDDMD